MNQIRTLFFVLFSLVFIFQVSAFTKRFEYLPPQDIPEFTFSDPHGSPVTLAHFKNKIVVLNIWSITCGPCMAEMPFLDRLSGLYSDKDLVVVPLNIDPTKIKALQQFFTRSSYQFLLPYHDHNQNSQKILRWNKMPTTLIFNKEGKLVGRQVGYAKWDSEEALKMFDQLIAGKMPQPSVTFWDKIKNWWPQKKD